MSLEAKVRAWEAAGIISAGQASEILRHEATARDGERPALLWAVVGLGLLALVLGIMLLVAANWDVIPHMLKLSVHLALTVAAAAAVWFASLRRMPWLREGSLFLLAGLTIGGIALQSQVYQLSGPAWQPLMAWLLLMTPAMLIAGRTRLTGHAWSLMLIATMSTLAYAHALDRGPWLLVHGLWMAVPFILLTLSALPWFSRREFGRALGDTGLVALLVGASLVHFYWAVRITPQDAADWAVRMVPPLIAAAIFAGAAHRWRRLPPSLILPLTLGPVLASAAALCIPHENDWAWRFSGFLVYCAMWGAIAWGAARAFWTPLFAIAVAAIAIRLFIVYVELFGSLASTGGGLVIGGLLLVALALGWQRATAWYAARRKAA